MSSKLQRRKRKLQKCPLLYPEHLLWKDTVGIYLHKLLRPNSTKSKTNYFLSVKVYK